MHAEEWIRCCGRYFRSISAARLRRELNRQRGHCTWCDAVVPRRRRMWCSQACVDAFMSRQPKYCASVTFRRDSGVCQFCGFDSVRVLRLYEQLRSLAYGWLSGRRGIDAYWHKTLMALLDELRRRGFKIRHHTQVPQLVEADHILAVSAGGGLSPSSNYRTLCVPCHKCRTRTQSQKRYAVRR